jgi:hypothetical protein
VSTAQLACSGDAVECQTAQQAYAIRCAQDQSLGALTATDNVTTLGTNVLNGTDTTSNARPGASASTTDVSGQVSDADLLSGGGIPQDQSFDVNLAGAQATLSLPAQDKLQSMATIIGQMMVIAAWIVAAFILFKK